MAVTVNTAGSIYTDQDGLLHTGRIKVSAILITSTAGNSLAVIRDGITAGSSIKLYVTSAGTHNQAYLDFSTMPLVFNNGIYLTNISASTHVTLVTTSAGAN